MKGYHSLLIAALVSCLFSSSCKSYSRYPIDSDPSVVIDTNLLGMWRCVEDTDKANFIEVEDFDDIYERTEKQYGSVENYLAKMVKDWQDDSAKGQGANGEAYKSYIDDLRWSIKGRKCLYYLTYFDNHGINPHYEAWNAYFSLVNKQLFLNVLYWNQVTDIKREEGHLLVHVIKLTRDTVVTAMVADQTLKNLQSSKEVRSRVAAKLNDKHFYSDTMHFYRIRRFHGDFNIATKLANPK